ncbi:TPA: NAD(P)H-dependent oxidoreductase [Candidatus Nomurabacteria bacterium]|nr:NAD(P)H-dependent oxidoreductase [Candidatus Nomurabacteria bacterium]
MKNITEVLEWRYATKKFDTNKKLTDEILNQILEAGRLSPSSLGLQPWKFILVENVELRTKLREAGYNQPQITDASHLVVLTYKNSLDEAYVDSYLKYTADLRGITTDDLKSYKDMIMGSITSRTPEELKVWNSRQVYIPLGVMLTASALLEVDTCPMEGFDTNKFDEILGLNEMGYSSTAILALGYRAEDDDTAHYKKSRFGTEEIIIRK